jgi:hypothetical protein
LVPTTDTVSVDRRSAGDVSFRPHDAATTADAHKRRAVLPAERISELAYKGDPSAT